MTLALRTPDILRLSQDALDELFRASPAGEIPQGKSKGTVMVLPGTGFAKVAAWWTRLFIWQGKVFDPERGILRNRISPFRFQSITARVYHDASVLDGRECIALDYSRTSLVARWVRDEIREVAPGTYLGIAYVFRVKTINFLLEFPPQR